MQADETRPENLTDEEEGQLSENSEGEGEDLTKKSIDSSDESEEDEEMTEADIKFIADDEEEDEEEREERRRRRKEAKLERRRKRLEEEEEQLSDDELDLINENIGRDTKKRLRKKADENVDDVAALFDEDEVQEPSAFREEELYESDDLEDFIIRDDSDENELDEETRRERIARRKERHEFAKNLGADHGISDNAWRDIEELFGDGMDYPHALYLKSTVDEYPQEEYDGEISTAVTKKKEISIRDVYEPSEIAEKMLTENDEKIRVVDIPERYQSSESYAPDDNEIGREATIITKSLMRDRPNVTEQALHSAVSSVLRFIRRDYFEVSFIWAHRRDYFDGILQLADLWAILDWDTKFVQVEMKKRSLLELIAQIATVDASITESEEVASIIEKIYNVDDVADAFAYVHLIYAVAIEQLNSQKGIRRGRMASWKTLYFDACKNGITEFGKLFNINYQDFVMSITGQESLHFPEDHHELPLVAAEKFTCSRFPTPESVLDAARNLISHEISVNPTLRAFLRRIFMADAVITVTATDKGIKEIQPGHPHYVAFKYLSLKPVHKFLDGQFLQIVQAETDGLVTIEIKVEEEIKLVKDLCKFICNDYANELAEHWNNERKRIAEYTAQDILFPQTVKWLKDKLLNTASDWVAARCQMALERKISMAPFKIPDNDEDTPVVMAISWGNGGRNDSTFCVILNENGVVIEFQKLDKLLERDHVKEDVQTIIEMISRHRPDAIAVGGFKPNTKTGLLKILTDSVLPGGENEPDWNKDLPIYLVDDEVARIYMTSKSGQREFPEKDYPPLIPYCVSLARFVQEPTCEYASLFNKDEDIKSLRLDPLQKYLMDETLLKSLERGFINVVNHVGVDINSACAYPHLSHTLKFVSGLGPRKAQSFISKIIRSGGKLQSRADLIQNEICAARIFVNCASFLRIRALHFRASYQDSAIDVLDDTRIHPQDYDLARKMAADALDLDDAVLDDDESPSLHVQELMEGDVQRLNLLLLDDYAVELERRTHSPKRVCLNDIKNELINPYKDHRRIFSGVSLEEAFMMLTGESKETLYEGALVNTVIARVKERWLNVQLPSGVDGMIHINNIDLPYGTDDLTRLFTDNQVLNTFVVKINFDRMSVDLSVKKEHIESHKSRSRVDDYFDFGMLDDEKTGKSMQKYKKKAITRNVQHPFWQSIDYKAAEKYLADRPRGDCVVRPSTKGNDHISITWKVDDKIFKHIDIKEEDKPNDWTLGKTLVINNKRYREIDQILADYIDPMTRRIARMIDHPKFQKKTLIEMHKFLEEQVAIFKRSVYGFILNPSEPGSFQLVYKHPANSVRQEGVGVTNRFYLFRKKEFKDVDSLLTYFKLSAQNEVKQRQKARPVVPQQRGYNSRPF